MSRQILLYQMRKSLSKQRVFRDRSNPFDIYNDHEFYQRFRFDKESVNFLCERFGTFCESKTYCHPLPKEVKILITLRFMASNSLQQVVGDLFGCSQSTICTTIWQVLKVIAHEINSFITLPTGLDLQRTQSTFKHLTNIPGIAGALDCTHVRAFVSNEQQHSFMNRKGYTSFNVQAICDQNYKFIHLYVLWPGSTHDSFVLKQSQLYSEMEIGRNSFILLGDSGYGNGKPWLLVPFLRPETSSERSYNYYQRRGRVVIEQAFGQCKRRFRGLSEGYRTDPNRAKIAITAAFILHNIAKDRHQPDSFDDSQPDEFLTESDVSFINQSENLSNFRDGRRFRDRIVELFFDQR